jgi:hypothetical protein
VHILDPFTGTGTFITRLLQSGLIKPEQLTHKYKHEIHANEIVLLAYYIAAINIEASYHSLAGGDYVPFEGICLTDTFQMYEKEDLVDALLVDNSKRRKRQKKLDIRVIVGNPPYSLGRRARTTTTTMWSTRSWTVASANLRGAIVGHPGQGFVRQLHPSHSLGLGPCRQCRDRRFVTNAGFLEANTADGCASAWRKSSPAFMCFTCGAMRAPRVNGDAWRRTTFLVLAVALRWRFRCWSRTRRLPSMDASTSTTLATTWAARKSWRRSRLRQRGWCC